MTLPDHLVVETSQRGFNFMPTLPSRYPGEVYCSESSGASEPLIWLRSTAPANFNEPNGPQHEVAIHLTAENAWKLADQLRYLVEHHYQGDARPVWARRPWWRRVRLAR